MDLRPLGALLALLLLGVSPASAQLQNAEDICLEPEEQLDPGRYVRSLSLDLRGTLPSELETNASIDWGDVPDGLVDEWLEGEGFLDRVVRQHRALTWNSVRNVTLLSFNQSLQLDNGIYWRRNASRGYRGNEVQCANEPARWDDDGRLRTQNVNGARLEGWVWVSPYWSPNTPVKICAYDAQEALLSSSGRDCSTPAGQTDTECGCGPALQWCGVEPVRVQIVESFAEAQDRLIRALVGEDRPYHELFTTRRAFVNGPLVHFWRNHAKFPASVVFEPSPVEAGRLPDLAFTDRNTWREVILPEGHAGLLTQPAFLMRFQTQRARAARFYDAFLCQPFQPPPGGLPDSDAECSREPDLQNRCGCKYCHALLEPSGAHWGRFAEQGVSLLRPEAFPPERADCLNCALTGQQCSDECRRFYLTTSTAPSERAYLGNLKAYVFRRPEHTRNVEVGPRLLALSAVADNRLPRCVARRTAEWLLGRPMTLADEEQAWLDALTQDFVTEDFSFKSLVKDIVSHPIYRRVR
jgi:hypothetical protein